MERENPFGALADFTPKTQPRAVKREQIDQLAAENNFPSRQAKPKAIEPRSRVTGRNQQINIKATAAVIERLQRISEARRMPLGEVLEHALEALEGKRAK